LSATIFCVTQKLLSEGQMDDENSAFPVKAGQQIKHFGSVDLGRKPA
jgi:hypothetical protein